MKIYTKKRRLHFTNQEVVWYGRCMRKVSIVVGLLYAFSLVTPSGLRASYVTIEKNGAVTVNVLAAEDEQGNGKGALNVTKLAENQTSTTPSVTLKKNNDKVQIIVANKEGEKELLVPEKTETLIEIEERPEVQKISIGLSNGKFSVQQRNYTALTDFPLTINSDNAYVVANTDNGDAFLSVLPVEAADAALRAGILTNVANNTMEILSEDKKLQYKITGEKVFDILNVYKYSVPAEAYVSATDGSILKIDSTTWYRFMNFLVG